MLENVIALSSQSVGVSKVKLSSMPGRFKSEEAKPNRVSRVIPS